MIKTLILILFLFSTTAVVCGNKQAGKTKKEPKRVKIRKSPRVYNLNQALRHKEYKRK